MSKLGYGERRDVLGELGFDSYEAYLASPPWRRIRKRALKRDRWLCAVCQHRATEVHHRSYRRQVLLGENIRPLVSLCRCCHHDIEFDGEEKRSLSQANERLCSLLIAAERSTPQRTQRARLKAPQRNRPDLETAQTARDLARLAATDARRAGPRKRSEARGLNLQTEPAPR